MKSILLSTITFFGIAFNGQCQSFEPTQIGLSYGKRFIDRSYVDDFYYDSTVVQKFNVNYITLSYKSFNGITDIGNFEFGVAANMDIGAAFCKATADNPSFMGSKSKVGFLLNFGVLAELYTAPSDEASFFVGAGGGLSFSGIEDGILMLGPQLEFGKQFYIGSILICASINYLEALNRTWFRGQGEPNVVLRDNRRQFQFTLAWNVDG